MLECGHQCHSVAHQVAPQDTCASSSCAQMPCLASECASRKTAAIESDLCAICYTSTLAEGACVALDCAHVFHAECLLQVLEHKWSTLRISFNFLSCPSCRQPLQLSTSCPAIQTKIDALKVLQAKIENQALNQAEDQGILEDARLSNPDDRFFNKP